MDRMIGTTMGPYTITERIGEGGMAIVYKGYQESLHRYVALKVLRDELARDQQFVARFRQEALAAANLNHPSILHVYDAGAANGKYFISMAYVDGGTLKEQIQQGLVTPERAVSITIQLAEALNHAHDQGLIHRDVKPSNVLMTRDGRPLLTDFGIAKALFEAQQLTRTGASIGTPEYMAPEQAQGKSPDGRTDIYALGVVLYEMLAARVPFCTDTPVATMYMHVHEPPPPLPRAQADIPEWLENVVCKALAKDPADRYPTAALFAAALRQGQESWATMARSGAVAAAAAAVATAAGAVPTRTPTPPGAVAAAGYDEAPTAVEVFTTPPEAEAVTAVEAAGTPVPAKRRRKALVPILIAAIALLVVATAASAAVLLMGGKGTPTPQVVTVEVVPEGPTEAVGDAGEEAPSPTEPVDGGTGTHTATSTSTSTPTGTSSATPTATPSGTASSTPSPSATASRTPTRTPTATTSATSTPTKTPAEVPTDTPVPPTQPPPTDTPPPPPTQPPPTEPPPTEPPPTEPPPTEPPPTVPPPTPTKYLP